MIEESGLQAIAAAAEQPAAQISIALLYLAEGAWIGLL
jgi:hypothetical protein